MKVKYGNYLHQVDSAGIKVNTRTERSQLGTPYQQTVSIGIEGKLKTLLGPKQIDKMMIEMATAYSYAGGDFALLHDDGSPTAHFYPNNQTIGGIRPEIISWPSYRGAEHVTYKTYNINLEFIIPLGIAPERLEFNESITINGGGPTYDVREVNYGPGNRHMTRTHEKCTAEQSGSMVGMRTYPNPAPPIWPQALARNPTITRKSPTVIGSVSTGQQSVQRFEVTWQYSFVWPERLDGTPHFLRG